MFLSAKIGDLAAAQAELEVYARKYELAEDVVPSSPNCSGTLLPSKMAGSNLEGRRAAVRVLPLDDGGTNATVNLMLIKQVDGFAQCSLIS